ncbi:hypothetical protein BS47DRAFT_1344941 [Hydnum rufescens UP504]|uniref:Uncharacterized protein n=1 Tax=Hydnum rufescens UP504 TaxID=1448309 RepID=A0A9P6DWJ5_9AGAM|nr:hypothetical protein BS47DRAFT_1344941 [Hydnum rufescens UP504]
MPFPIVPLPIVPLPIFPLPIFISSIDRDRTRINVGLKGGTWKRPDGTLLANIVAGVGGELGYIDINQVFHMEFTYAVQFVEDNKWGYVHGKGFSTPTEPPKTFYTLESDSVAAKGLTEQTLYASGQFKGELLDATNYAFVGAEGAESGLL